MTLSNINVVVIDNSTHTFWKNSGDPSLKWLTKVANSAHKCSKTSKSKAPS